MEEMDVSEEDRRDTLFFLEAPFGDVLCGGVISSGQGIRRCCTLPVIDSAKMCGVGLHSIKAEVPPNSFCVQTKVKGGKEGLPSKCILVTDMLLVDISYFEKEKHTPAEWECIFDHVKLAWYGNGPPVSDSVRAIDNAECTILGFMPTPKKPRTQEQLGGGAGRPPSPTWVELPSLSEVEYMRPIRTSVNDTPNRKAQNIQAVGENFEVLRLALP
jgi:hypothetical protein